MGLAAIVSQAAGITTLSLERELTMLTSGVRLDTVVNKAFMIIDIPEDAIKEDFPLNSEFISG